jgi:hypothetical protein
VIFQREKKQQEVLSKFKMIQEMKINTTTKMVMSDNVAIGIQHMTKKLLLQS